MGFLSINGLKLELSEEPSLLGVTMDSKLTWKLPIIQITRKAITALMQCKQILSKTWEIKPSTMKWTYTASITVLNCIRNLNHLGTQNHVSIASNTGHAGVHGKEVAGS